MTQLLTDHLFGWLEIMLLLLMSYECYVAICMPLHYLVIMRQMVCVVLLMVSWLGHFLYSVIQLSTIYELPFCGPNVLNHFMCDMFSLLKLICTDHYVIDILVVANGRLIYSMSFLHLLIFNGVILHSLQNLNQEGRQNALQTCALHINVVVSFFIPLYFHVCKTC